MKLIKNKTKQIGFISFLLFAISVSPVIACGILVPGGCGMKGATTGGFETKAPSCNLCACQCGWFECCATPLTGGAHLQFLWSAANQACGCGSYAAKVGDVGALEAATNQKTQAGTQSMSQTQARSSIMDSMSGGGRESCSQFANRTWREAGWDPPGGGTGNWLNYSEAYAGESSLKPGDAIIVKSSASPSGRHIVLYHSTGTVVHDPGLAAGAAKMSSFYNYEANIIGIVHAPY